MLLVKGAVVAQPKVELFAATHRDVRAGMSIRALQHKQVTGSRTVKAVLS